MATQSLEENIKTITCAQKPKDHADQIAIGCIGDSITAGVHSEGGPSLAILLSIALQARGGWRPSLSAAAASSCIAAVVVWWCSDGGVRATHDHSAAAAPQRAGPADAGATLPLGTASLTRRRRHIMRNGRAAADELTTRCQRMATPHTAAAHLCTHVTP